MIITLDTTVYILISIFIILFVTLLALFIIFIYKYKKLMRKYYTNKRNYLRKSNQLSMIGYRYRSFKEGENAFTVLRDMGEVLSNVVEANDEN